LGSITNAVIRDAWLADHVPAIIAAAASRGMVALTWDEDDDDTTDNHNVKAATRGTDGRPVGHS
jgi:hypothetical protein